MGEIAISAPPGHNRLKIFYGPPAGARVYHKYSYRLRVGNYRVFFDFDGEVKVVSIEEVRKRDERTY